MVTNTTFQRIIIVKEGEKSTLYFNKYKNQYFYMNKTFFYLHGS